MTQGGIRKEDSRYQYRGYRNPRRYWNKHSSLHRLSRTRLSEKDFAFYRTAKRWGLLDELIPEVSPRYRPRLDWHERGSVVASYFLSDGTALQGSTINGHCIATTLRIWREHRFPIKPKGSPGHSR